MRPHDPGQRVRDAGGSGAARVPPQVFRVQQVRSTAGARGPLLSAGRQSGVRAGLAQATQGLGGVGAGGAQRQGGPAAAKSGLRHRSVSFLHYTQGTFLHSISRRYRDTLYNSLRSPCTT